MRDGALSYDALGPLKPCAFHRLSRFIIQQRLKKTCCSKKCTHGISTSAAYRWCLNYVNKAPLARRNFLLGCIRLWSTDDKGQSAGTRVRWRFVDPDGCVEPRSVCRRAFRHITGIGEKTLEDYQRRVRDGALHWVSYRVPQDEIRQIHRSLIKTAMTNIADPMPDKDYVRFPFKTKKALFGVLKTHCSQEKSLFPEGHSLCYSTMCSVLSEPEFKKKIRWHRVGCDLNCASFMESHRNSQ
jgi:hypothetical protein